MQMGVIERFVFGEAHIPVNAEYLSLMRHARQRVQLRTHQFAISLGRSRDDLFVDGLVLGEPVPVVIVF